jgi:hypothetical protein
VFASIEVDAVLDIARLHYDIPSAQFSYFHLQPLHSQSLIILHLGSADGLHFIIFVIYSSSCRYI